MSARNNFKVLHFHLDLFGVKSHTYALIKDGTSKQQDPLPRASTSQAVMKRVPGDGNNPDRQVALWKVCIKALPSIAQAIMEVMDGTRVLSDEELQDLSECMLGVDQNALDYSLQELVDTRLLHAISTLAEMQEDLVPGGATYKFVARAKRLLRIWACLQPLVLPSPPGPLSGPASFSFLSPF